MAFSWSVDDERRRVRSRFDGTLTAEVVFRYHAEVLRNPDLSAFDELADCTGLRHIDVGVVEMRTLADDAARALGGRGATRAAFLVRGALAFGMARMYQAYCGLAGDPREIRAFRDSAAAEAWLDRAAGSD
ncbi:MAG: hypothetical protein RJQ04_02370 [Longimicrobiales bacterium]